MAEHNAIPIQIESSLSRLDVMSRINHPEEYYKQAFKSKGIDVANLTLGEICAGISAMKAVEADYLIWASKNIPVSNDNEIEASVAEIIEKGW